MKLVFIFLILNIVINCQSVEAKSSGFYFNTDSETIIDTSQLLKVFEKSKSQESFTRFLNNDLTSSVIKRTKEPLIIEDLNGDAHADALVPFICEDQSNAKKKSKESNFYYAVFLNKNGKLIFQNLIDRTDNKTKNILTIDKIENTIAIGKIGKSSKGVVLYRYIADHGNVLRVKRNSYFWKYNDLKLNNKLSLNAKMSEILPLLGKPDRIERFFHDCNVDPGKIKLYHFGGFLLAFNEKNRLTNENFELGSTEKIFMNYGNIRLDKNTTYEEILKLSPYILKQHPGILDLGNEETEMSKEYKILWIPLQEYLPYDPYNDVPFGRNWMSLTFKNKLLISVEIGYADCEI
ncbi:MAG TPA: hypothetical protein VLZ83_15940 [Edaphocola sp.]|nr:hypothetical protein [Edaphocola sp.]